MSEPRGIRVGTVLGAPVLLQPAWFLVAAVLALTFGHLAADWLPRTDAPLLVTASLVFAALLLASVFLHELAHALAARATGTPVSHIVLDLWGGHTAFGAQITSPGRSIAIALAGPSTNALLALLTWLVHVVTDAAGLTALILLALATANAFIAAFNVLPGLPLDGGRVVEGIVWRITGDRWIGTTAAGWTGRAVALAVAGTALRALLAEGPADSGGAVWSVLLAVLLWQGAGQSLVLARWHRALPRLRAVTLMRPAAVLPAGSTVADVLVRAGPANVPRLVLLAPDGRPGGIVDPQALHTVPADRAGQVPATAVVRPLHPEARLALDTAGDHLLNLLQTTGHREYAVLHPDGAVAGVLARSDVTRALNT
jgi:Zn-dependent protease